jgi:hypothetical protein
MKFIHLNQDINLEGTEYSYTASIAQGNNIYFLEVSPIVRMGCNYLSERSGAVTIAIYNDDSDCLCVHAAGGKDLAKETIKVLNKVLIEANLINKEHQVEVISFQEFGMLHYLKGVDEQICSICLNPVSFENVSNGYAAICVNHDANLMSFDII